MASTVLDYGEPDGTTAMDQVAQMAGVPKPREDTIDEELARWEQNYQGPPEELDEQRRRKREELISTLHPNNKFYALPKEQAIEAGAQRGVEPQPMDEGDLMGDEVDTSELPEVPGTIGQGLDIRYNALHLIGQPITQCSTSRLFAYITHFGAQPLGLEWINDHSCNIVFGDAASARLAIEYLCPAVPSDGMASLPPLPSSDELVAAAQVKRAHETNDTNGMGSMEEREWTETFMASILTPRKAHRIPGKLYNAPEHDAAQARKAFEQQQAGQRPSNGGDQAMEATEEIPEIYREMEQEDRLRFLQQPAQSALQKLRSPLWVRWTVESLDVKANRSAQQSKWYRDHGRDAGKEVVSKVLRVGAAGDRRERRREAPDSAQQRHEASIMAELDREMDAYRDRADDAAVGGDAEARRRRRRGSRSAVAMDRLDEEMELDHRRRDRSASPVRRAEGRYGEDRYRDGRYGEGRLGTEAPYTTRADGVTTVRVRGRGKMRAPSAWDDDRQALDGRLDNYMDRRTALADRLRMPTGATSAGDTWSQSLSTNLADRLRVPGSDREDGRDLHQRLSPANGGSSTLQSRIR